MSKENQVTTALYQRQRACVGYIIAHSLEMC